MFPGLLTSLAPMGLNMLQTAVQAKPKKPNHMLSLASQLMARKPSTLPQRTIQKAIPRPLPPPSMLQRGGSVEQKKDNTMIYVGIGAVALVGIILVTKK